MRLLFVLHVSMVRECEGDGNAGMVSAVHDCVGVTPVASAADVLGQYDRLAQKRYIGPIAWGVRFRHNFFSFA